MAENQTPQAPQKTDNRTASQKISDLENAVLSLYQTVDNMARDLMTIKEALKLLGNKTDSIVKASASGEQITDEVIARLMVQNNVEELAQRVKVMVAQGILQAQEQVGADSFLVGQELNDEGKVENPRLQFALGALKPELQDKIKGARPGDVLTLEEGKLKFKVLETYQIQQPRQPESQDRDPAQVPTPEAAPQSTAPAADPAASAAPAAPVQPDQSVTPAQ